MMTQSIHIRKATKDNLLDIARIHVASWQEAYRGLVPQDYLDALDVTARQKNWEQIMEGKTREDKNLFLAEYKNNVVGFIHFGRPRDETMKQSGEIYAVYVLPETCGKAVGYTLFTAAQKFLSDAGYSDVYLWALDTNAFALAAYKRWGGEMDNLSYKDDAIGGQDVREIMVKFKVNISRHPAA